MTTAEFDIETLGKSFKFYLGGSRRMAERNFEEPLRGEEVECVSIKEYTDWDYYATWTKELSDALLKLDWSDSYPNAKSGEYIDTEAIQIFEKRNHQIVLRKNAEFYNEVFESIPTWFYIKHLWKSGPNRPTKEYIQKHIEMLFTLKRKWSNP